MLKTIKKIGGVVCCLLGLAGCALEEKARIQNGFGEREFAREPNLRASLEHVVAIHLEHPDTPDEVYDLTGTRGHDSIPYHFSFDKSEAGRIEFCFEGDREQNHTMTVEQEGTQQEMVRVELNRRCSVQTLTTGDYIFHFQHGGSGDPKEARTFFIRLLSEESATLSTKEQDTKTIIVDNSCVQCDLRGMHLRHADLKKAKLRSARLNHVDLDDADLRQVDLKEAKLNAILLRNADLRNADLRNADLRNAKVNGADLRDANMSGAIYIDGRICDNGSIGQCK